MHWPVSRTGSFNTLHSTPLGTRHARVAPSDARGRDWHELLDRHLGSDRDGIPSPGVDREGCLNRDAGDHHRSSQGFDIRGKSQSPTYRPDRGRRLSSARESSFCQTSRLDAALSSAPGAWYPDPIPPGWYLARGNPATPIAECGVSLGGGVSYEEFLRHLKPLTGAEV